MDHKEENHPLIPHQLVLHQRNLLDLEGVTEVDHFDELSVVVYTSQGELTICGQNLHVRQLNLESGALSIEGHVDSLTYRDLHKKSGLFGRLLR